MSLFHHVAEGVQSLTDHPFRTFLTTLGIIFGTAAVIAMVSIGAGAEREALEELKRFGPDSIRIQSKPIEGERLKDAVKKLARGLSIKDAEVLLESCPFIKNAVGEKTFDTHPVYCLGKRPAALVVGVGDGFPEASRFEIDKGRFFDYRDAFDAAPVAVLGAAVAQELVAGEDPCGLIIQIGRVRFRVVGVMRERSKSGGKLAIKSRDHDRDVYIPLTTARERLFKWPLEDRERYHELSALWINVREGTDLSGARDVIMRILKRRHRDVDDVEALVPLEILQQSQKTQELFNLVMACIAGLSLLVGGIGIMNIMLASVNERTREIGVRRALGATRGDITGQFLAESALISLSGGVLGIGVGIALAWGISLSTGWTTVIPMGAVFLAFGVSLGVGIIFGLFPAVKAARLDPVTALRYE
ncbi:MAG: ABC transporter permease [Candidatus Ozemobacteraceae bacterium]